MISQGKQGWGPWQILPELTTAPGQTVLPETISLPQFSQQGVCVGMCGRECTCVHVRALCVCGVCVCASTQALACHVCAGPGRAVHLLPQQALSCPHHRLHCPLQAALSSSAGEGVMLVAISALPVVQHSTQAL